MSYELINGSVHPVFALKNNLSIWRKIAAIHSAISAGFKAFKVL